jgi:hypothetical protein
LKDFPVKVGRFKARIGYDLKKRSAAAPGASVNSRARAFKMAYGIRDGVAAANSLQFQISP